MNIHDQSRARTVQSIHIFSLGQDPSIIRFYSRIMVNRFEASDHRGNEFHLFYHTILVPHFTQKLVEMKIETHGRQMKLHRAHERMLN